MSEETILELPDFRVTPHLIQSGPSSIAVRQINSVTVESVDWGRKSISASSMLAVAVLGLCGFVAFSVGLVTMVGANDLRSQAQASGGNPLIGLIQLGVSAAFWLGAVKTYKAARRDIGERWRHTVIATTSNGASKIFTTADLDVACQIRSAIEAAITHPGPTAPTT